MNNFSNVITVDAYPRSEFLTKFQGSNLKSLLLHELSGIEPVAQVFVCSVSENDAVMCCKKYLSSLGFKIGLMFGNLHFADFEAVMNINRSIFDHFLIPVYGEKILDTSFYKKWVPGRERLHIRGFKINSNQVVVIPHVDHNWLSLQLHRVYTAHFKSGQGDYVAGSDLFNTMVQAIR